MHVETRDTPERRAFYDRIDGKSLTALWTVMGNLITPRAEECLLALRLGLSRYPRGDDRGR